MALEVGLEAVFQLLVDARKRFASVFIIGNGGSAAIASHATIDFVNVGMGPGTRTSVELSLDTAKALSAALIRAIEAAEVEEAGRGL